MFFFRDDHIPLHLNASFNALFLDAAGKKKSFKITSSFTNRNASRILFACYSF